ncbi:MAG: CDP-archaeol synthase [Cyanobacteria bacterium P01_F01_bin.42]
MTATLQLILQDIGNLGWLLLALLIAGILEYFAWKTPVFQWLNVPIQRDWFGENKRWRGLFSLPLMQLAPVYGFAAIESYFHLAQSEFLQGWTLFSNFNLWQYALISGFIFNLAELPNSFIKRRFGIAPGEASGWGSFIGDHVDSTYGLLLAWLVIFHFPWHLVLVGAIACPLLFMASTLFRQRVGLKA